MIENSAGNFHSLIMFVSFVFFLLFLIIFVLCLKNVGGCEVPGGSFPVIPLLSFSMTVVCWSERPGAAHLLHTPDPFQHLSEWSLPLPRSLCQQVAQLSHPSVHSPVHASASLDRVDRPLIPSKAVAVCVARSFGVVGVQLSGWMRGFGAEL